MPVLATIERLGFAGPFYWVAIFRYGKEYLTSPTLNKFSPWWYTDLAHLFWRINLFYRKGI